MPAGRITLKIRNTNVDASNYALVGFSFGAGADLRPEYAAANSIAYIGALSSIYGSGTRIVSANWRGVGSAGGVDIPFPLDDFNDIRGFVAGSGIDVPAQTDYEQDLGTGSLAPLGTSVSVSEVTATVGRSGRGRHFLPYINSGQVDSQGRFNAGAVAGVKNTYGILFLQTFAGYPTLVQPVVTGPNFTAPKDIVLVKPQPILSNLESRRR